MPILVTDFDGTLTERDFYGLILEIHDPPGARDVWRRFAAGEATHFESIRDVFASLRTDREGAEALVSALAPPPGLADAVARLRRAGWDLEIASAGCAWYIERVLDSLGIEATLHACPGTFSPETGLVMRPADGSPFAHPGTGIDKPAVVRAALERDPVVAVAGDSGTDREGLLLVPSGRRFARRGVADALAAEGRSFRRFETWPEIVEMLVDGDDATA